MCVLPCSRDRRGGNNSTNGSSTGDSGHGVSGVSSWAGSGSGRCNGVIVTGSKGDGGVKGGDRENTNQFENW